VVPVDAPGGAAVTHCGHHHKAACNETVTL
jgi:hypothetical protein